jgi:hypothetical protein
LPERFADIPTVVARLLGQSVNAPQRVGITTPARLTGLLPFIRVTRAGGPRDRVNDYARISIDVLDDSYDRAITTAENVATYLEHGRLRYGATLLDRVVVDSAPQEVVPWAPGIFRIEAAYTIVSRRRSVA